MCEVCEVCDVCQVCQVCQVCEVCHVCEESEVCEECEVCEVCQVLRWRRRIGISVRLRGLDQSSKAQLILTQLMVGWDCSQICLEWVRGWW